MNTNSPTNKPNTEKQTLVITGLKIFQQQAFNVAFAFLSSNNEK